MKKIITLLVLVFSCVFAKAQLTLTSASFPHLGDFFITHNDTLTSLLTPGLSGANQTWDFASLNNHFNDTTSVVSVASTPDGALFPTAQLAGKMGANYAYMTETATECDFIGLVGSFQGSPTMDLHYSSPDIVAKSGITFNSSYNYLRSWVKVTTGAAFNQPLADSVRVHYDTYVSKVADAWGTVTSPFGSFPCLRIKENDSTILVVDAYYLFSWHADVFDQTSLNVSYSFVDDAKLDAIVQLNMDSTSSTVGSASYRDSWFAGVDESVTPSLFTIYPNPNSGNDIHLLVGGLPSDKYEIQLFDLCGKQLTSDYYSVNKTGVTDVNWSSLSLAAGSYFAVVSKGNQVLQKLKFEVIK